jgi:cytochrome c-type biogenesis protein
MTLAFSFPQLADTGPLVVAMAVSAVAGLVSFLSPCVLPLVPGYLSYVAGLTGTELSNPSAGGSVGDQPVRARVVLGAALFVLGFSVVFVTTGALFGSVGTTLQAHATLISRVLGVVAVLLGLAFIGWLPGLQREVRVHRLPAAGLMGAPVLGFLFGLGWTPCVGPTLGVVLGLAADPNTASAARGALLTTCYCLGLGLPFVLAAGAVRRTARALGFVRRHYVWVLRAGGLLLVVIGILLISGLWDRAMIELRHSYAGFTPSV